jgi:ABC-2 type transport system permease protein
MPLTLVLVRKLLRDVRWPLAVVCLLLFLFSLLWVRVAWRVTTEIAPYFNAIGQLVGSSQAEMEEVVFTGVGKVSQAVLGGSDINFQKPTDFLAVELLHPVIIVLVFLWAVGKSSGAISGELGGGTMELLLSQPVPRGRLILAHLLVDGITIPVMIMSIVVGTQLGMWSVGEFREKQEVIDKVNEKVNKRAGESLPQLPFMDKPQVQLLRHREAKVLEVSTADQWKGALNLAALVFAMSGLGLVISACGRNRWRTTGWAVLLVLGMFVLNVIAQLWDPLAFTRPFTLFFYYQPHRHWLDDIWTADVGACWGMGEGQLTVPAVPLLLAIGVVGYAAGWWVFRKRDLPAPL